MLALAACSVQPVTRVVQDPNLEARAQAEVRAGNLGSAARLYRQLADASRGEQRADYLIQAARLLIEGGDPITARSWLGEAVGVASIAQRKVAFVLEARIELAQDSPELALRALGGIQDPVPVELMVEIGAVRGLAYFALNRPAEAVRELVEREVWLNESEEILANQRMIWDGLRAMAAGAAPGAAPGSGDIVVDGWLALAPLARSNVDSLDFRRALLEWRSVYVDHPAAGGLLLELLSEQRSSLAYPTQVALLLPMNSAQREAAIAVRDGFLAAHLQSSQRRETTVRIYDTAQLGGREAYLRAQLEGADFIVGPLLRADVEEVIPQSGFVPTLTLNFSQNETPFSRSVHQFALWPEDEARAVARRAIAEGATTAVAIIASNDWGYRVLNDFRAEFEALGGRLLDFAGYDPNLQDFSPQITSLLNITSSTQRQRRLAANLGVPIEFEARRRQDVDMIFLGADTAQAGRLLAPQLRFFDAGDIPTYATSEIYDPGSDISDTDMNGVIFPDAPLLVAPDSSSAQLSREFAAHWPRRAPRLLRLYGMGFDAHRLMNDLYSSADTYWPLMGVSGRLSVDAEGKIHRDLPFAQFRNGRPEALPQVLPENTTIPFIGAR
jgi:outer membrane PBP1 activator LpoA protein